MSRVPTQVAAAVESRRGGTCEATGLPVPAVEYHHRQARQMGGSTGRELDTAANLVGLCKRHHQWMHAHPRQARAGGFIVPSWDDPAAVPIIPGPRWGRC